MQRMGCVPSLQRGEIVVFNLGNPHFGSTSVDKLLGNEVVRSVTKVPAVRNENWERAKPAFKPFLEEDSYRRGGNVLLDLSCLMLQKQFPVYTF